LKSKYANKGKKLEGELKTHLQALTSKKDFWWTEFSDSYTAQGRPMPRVLSDFLCVWKGTPIAIEAKESSVPSLHYKKRLKQLGRIYRFTMAGGKGYFVVKHKGEYYLLDIRKVYDYKYKYSRKSYPFTSEGMKFKNLKELLNEVIKD